MRASTDCVDVFPPLGTRHQVNDEDFLGRFWTPCKSERFCSRADPTLPSFKNHNQSYISPVISNYAHGVVIEGEVLPVKRKKKNLGEAPNPRGHAGEVEFVNLDPSHHGYSPVSVLAIEDGIVLILRRTHVACSQ